MTETLTAAERYAALKQDRFEQFIDNSFSDEQLKGVDLFEVKCPSGMAFKCRKLDQAYAANAGQLPMVLSAQVAGMQSDENAFEKMTPDERLASMRVSAQMVRYICVEPRLTVDPVTDERNAIWVNDLTFEDFAHLSQWAQGGESAEGLKTFRRKRR